VVSRRSGGAIVAQCIPPKFDRDLARLYDSLDLSPFRKIALFEQWESREQLRLLQRLSRVPVEFVVR
jgi:hypothetical protein